MSLSLVLPVAALAAVAWLVPWGIGKLVPEGVGWLAVNGVVSSALLGLLAGVGFVFLYGDAGGAVWREAPGHFVLLAGKAAIIWAPVMVLSLANLPRGWREVEW